MLRADNARMPVRVDVLHDILLVFIVAFPVFGTFFPFSTYFGYSGSDTTAILALILLCVLLMFARQPQKAIFALKRSWLIFAFCFWALATSKWAEVPMESFTRSGRLLVYALYAIYLVEMVDERRSTRIMGLALLISLFASVVVIAVLPAFAGSTDGRGVLGTWRGAMGHKNVLGVIAGIGFLFALISLKTLRFDRRLSIMLLGMSAILLVLANSVTAIIAALIVLSVLFYSFYMLPLIGDRILGTLLAILFAGVGGLAIFSLGSVLELLGREGTLTGRGSIWAYANILIDQNPFWGYGHGAWKFPLFAEKALVTLHWPIAHGHNTWIDLRLQLGLPGFLLAVFLVAVAFKNLLYLLMTRPIGDFIFSTSIFVVFGIRSYSETEILDPSLGDMFWFAFAFASLANLANRERASRRRRRIALQTARPISSTKRSFGAQPSA